MTRHQKQEQAAIVEEMRRLARSGVESSPALDEWRDLAAADRGAKQEAVLEALVEKAHVDLRSIVEGAQELERSRQIDEGLAELEADASRLANEDKARFLRVRAHYRDGFEGQLAGPGGPTQLKFRDVIYSYGDAFPGKCPQHLGSGIFSPWIGPDSIAEAEIAASTDTPGMWLHPFIQIKSNSCDETREGRTFQDVTYNLDAPSTSFGVEAVRVDLIANGVSSAKFGDTGWFTKPDPFYDHTYVSLDVYLAQQVDGEWSFLPLVSDTLFAGHGEGARQVRSVLSGQTYPFNFFVRGADIGGGDLMCLAQVTCSAIPIGSHAKVRLDFSAASGLGIFVGGVALIGTSA